MLNQFALRDKRLIALDDELRELNHTPEIRVTLDEPIQRGWRRSHMLTERAQSLAGSDVFQSLLAGLGAVQYSRTPDFLGLQWVGRRWQRVKRGQPINVVNQGDWDHLKWPPAWKGYFRTAERFPERPWLDRFEFRWPWHFMLKVEPHMVDTVYVPDSAVERRISEIESWIRNHGLEYRWYRIRDRRLWKVPNTKWKSLEREAQREMRNAQNLLHEVDMDMLHKHFHTSLRALLLSPA